MKLKAIKKIVKQNKMLVIEQSANGDTWVGTNSLMYNIGAVGGEPEKVIKWLFEISDMELEKYDRGKGEFLLPADGEVDDYICADELSVCAIEDKNGNAVLPFIFAGAVYLLGDWQCAPLAGIKNLSYFFDVKEKRVQIYKGLFAVASIEVSPVSAVAPFYEELKMLIKLMENQAKK